MCLGCPSTLPSLTWRGCSQAAATSSPAGSCATTSLVDPRTEQYPASQKELASFDLTSVWRQSEPSPSSMEPFLRERPSPSLSSLPTTPATMPRPYPPWQHTWHPKQPEEHSEQPFTLPAGSALMAFLGCPWI